MRIISSKKMMNEMARMYVYHMVSSKVNGWFSYGVNEATVIPADLDQARAQAKEDALKFPRYSEDEILLYGMIKDQLKCCLQGNNSAVRDVFLERLAKEMRVFYLDEFSRNPYIRNIRFEPRRCGRFRLEYTDFEPFELFFYDSAVQYTDLWMDIPRIGCFAEKCQFPIIVEETENTAFTWMSVSPNEVCTMEKPIEHASGNVLTLGCGMGYFAYMASMKDDVASVTVVEREQDVIDLFQKHILPQFEHKEKISIVKGDAVEYLRNMTDGEFDYCFADIWSAVNDIEPYFAVKEIGRDLRKTRIEYWIEDSIACYLSEYVWLEILGSLFGQGDDQLPYTMYENMAFKGSSPARYIHRLLQNEEISRVEHIRYYMDHKNIISMIDQTDILF